MGERQKNFFFHEKKDKGEEGFLLTLLILVDEDLRGGLGVSEGIFREADNRGAVEGWQDTPDPQHRPTWHWCHLADLLQGGGHRFPRHLQGGNNTFSPALKLNPQTGIPTSLSLSLSPFFSVPNEVLKKDAISPLI